MTPKPGRGEPLATDTQHSSSCASARTKNAPSRPGSRRRTVRVIAERHAHGGDRSLLALQFAGQGNDLRSPLEGEPRDMILKQQLVGACPA